MLESYEMGVEIRMTVQSCVTIAFSGSTLNSLQFGYKLRMIRIKNEFGKCI